MIRKLTLEQRVARLEKFLKENNRTKQRKFEYGTYGQPKDALLADAKELKALLKNKGIIDPEVNPDGDYLIVSLDWEYYGPGAFLVLPTDKGYILHSDRYNKRKKFCKTLDEVADSIPGIDLYELDSDL